MSKLNSIFYFHFTRYIGVFYYTLGNIDPMHHSQLKAMQLLAIAKKPVIKKYGCNEILQSFMTQLNQLEQVITTCTCN